MWVGEKVSQDPQRFRLAFTLQLITRADFFRIKGRQRKSVNESHRDEYATHGGIFQLPCGDTK